MKKIFSLLFIVFALVPKSNATEIDGKVEALLKSMTLEEKIGQMTQLNISLLRKKNIKSGEDPLDIEKVREVIVSHHVGSILNAIGGYHDINSWHKIITEIQDVATKETKHGIPVIYGIDAIHGAGYLTGSTLYPHNIGIAATRNTDLAYRCAKATAKEVRATGVRWNFDPVLDAGRQPLWSRFPETYGEDVCLITQLGLAVINGYEGEGLSNHNSVASCIKHFLGYSKPASGWDRTPAQIPEIELREYYLPQFKAAIDAGAHTVMVNSGEVNGIPVHANKYLLTDVLRDELGFEGVVITDWEDIKYLHSRHKVASNNKEAVKMAVDAGIDMSMVPFDYSFQECLKELVQEKSISEERINESVRRILSLKMELGLFDNPFPEKRAIKNFQRPEYKDLAYSAAAESITLLKNQNQILPLAVGKKVLLAGPSANNKSSLHGCWSYSWLGDNEGLYPKSTKTIKSAIEGIIGKDNLICSAQSDYDDPRNFLMANTDSVDVIVLCLGENAYAESPGSIHELGLAKEQIDLVRAARKFNKPVIAVLVEGRPRIVRKIEPLMDAVLMAYWPGEKGADAIGDALFGKINPSGKLPFTYPRYSGYQIKYDCKYSELGKVETQNGYSYKGYNPQWPFGFGLSYSTFKYSNFAISSKELRENEVLSVSILVTNTGKFKGKECVELYTRDHFASVTPSWRRLRKFKKIELKPNQSTSVIFNLDKDDIKFIGQDLRWRIEEGWFDVVIKNNVLKFKYCE